MTTRAASLCTYSFGVRRLPSGRCLGLFVGVFIREKGLTDDDCICGLVMHVEKVTRREKGLLPVVRLKFIVLRASDKQCRSQRRVAAYIACCASDFGPNCSIKSF